MQYTPLIEADSISRSSMIAMDHIDTIIPLDHTDHFCRTCRTKSTKNQETTHTPIECLSERCEFLENEVIRLKDHDIKSRLHIKELESKITGLEDAVKGLTAPKQTQAAPYSFGIGHKLRHQLKKTQSEDVPPEKGDVNYDNILQPKRSDSRERVGLFGSLGASSQYR